MKVELLRAKTKTPVWQALVLVGTGGIFGHYLALIVLIVGKNQSWLYFEFMKDSSGWLYIGGVLPGAFLIAGLVLRHRVMQKTVTEK